MSHSPARGSLRRRAASLATGLGAAALVAGAFAPGANAAFTSGKCAGGDVLGRGSSLQTTAQANWKPGFQFTYCTPDPGTFPNVTYDAAGSGAGRRAMGERSGANADGSQSRNQAPRFAGTDDPLSESAGRPQIEQGTDATGDEGKIHEVPVAVGAMVALVNFPDNCDVKSLPASNQTDPAATDGTDRVRLTKDQFEAAWFNKGSDGGTVGTWGDLFPSIAAVSGNAAGKTDSDCAAQPIVRVTRFDDSGSTYVVKDELNAINPGRGWKTTYLGNPNTIWPNAASNRVDAGSNGGGAQASKLIATDGSIGYADLATARAKGFAITPSNAAGAQADKYWMPVQNGSGAYTEPTVDPNSYKSGGSATPTKGANCSTVTFTGVPSTPADATLGDWSNTSGVNSPAGYAMCTVTWDLAFDDDAPVYGNTPAEEAKARTVKDYLSYIVSDAGQGVLLPNDYAPLPSGTGSLLEKARTGVNAIGWNKSGDSADCHTTNTCPPPPCEQTNTCPKKTCQETNSCPGPSAPSNQFSILSATVLKSSTIRFRLQLPGQGHVSITGSGRSGRKRVGKAGSGSASPSHSGVATVTFRPSRGVVSLLRHGKSVKLTLKVSFRPTGGTTRTQTRTITLRGRRHR